MNYLINVVFASVLPLIIHTNAAVEGLVWNLTCDTHEKVTRAVGANFSVQIVSPCREDPIGCRIRYGFYENTKDISLGWKEITINRAGGTVTATEPYQEQGATTYYSYKNTSDNNAVIFQLEMVPENRRVAMIFRVKSSFPHCPVHDFQFATVAFTDCSNHTNLNVMPQSTDIARYMDVGDIVCDKYGRGRAIFANGSEALRTYCDADANWKDAEEISCLYPMKSTLLIDGSTYSERVTLLYNPSSGNQMVSLVCAPGPRTASHFALNNRNINISLNIYPRFNGNNVSCYIENNFTEHFGLAAGDYSTSVLDIKFGPHPPPGHINLCWFSDGSVRFYSNPPSSNDSLSLIENGTYNIVPSTIETCCEQGYGVAGQRIIPNISGSVIQLSRLYLRSNLFGQYVNYSLMPCDNVETTSTTLPSATQTRIPSGTDSLPTISKSTTLLVILSVVAGFLLMALIGCLLWQRQLEGAERLMHRDS